MPSIKCSCNQRINLGSIPNKDEWLLISDIQYDEFSGTIDAEKLYQRMKPLIKCPNCARLLIFWNGFNESYTTYAEEKDSG